MRSRLMFWAALFGSLMTGCVHPVSPESLYRAGQREQALADQQALAAEETEEQALHQLRLASMAWSMGDAALAEQALRGAVGEMQDFKGEGEFRSLVFSEDAKTWKGEPYEKMGAFFYLGMLLFQAGDRDNALAMFKSAILADAGTVEQRYRSDFIPAYVLQALAYQAEGEPHNAEDSMARAVDALYARALTDKLIQALEQTASPESLDARDAQTARALLLEGLPAGLTVAARDPAEAVRAALSQATDVVRVQMQLPKRERWSCCSSYSKSELEDGLLAMGELAPLWAATAEAIPEEELLRIEQQAARLSAMLETPPNLVLVLDQGQGPRKRQRGRYGEELVMEAGQAPRPLPQLRLQGESLRPLELDSWTYQATTRGSRPVDAILKGKAVYKDASLISGYVLGGVADIAYATDNQDLALVMELVSLVMHISSALTMPEADTREWGLLPERISLWAGAVEPGTHTLTVDGISYELEVPARGSLVTWLPSLPPRGPQQLPPPRLE